MIVPVTKDHFDFIKEAEETSGKKAKHSMIAVPDCINGIYGVYRVKKCFRKNKAYFADMKLLQEANSSLDAEVKVFKYMKEQQEKVKRKTH